MPEPINLNVILLIISIVIPILIFRENYLMIKFMGAKGLIMFFASAIALIIVIRSIRLALEYNEEAILRALNDLILPVVILLLFYLFAHRLRIIFCKTFKKQS